MRLDADMMDERQAHTGRRRRHHHGHSQHGGLYGKQRVAYSAQLVFAAAAAAADPVTASTPAAADRLCQ